MFEPRLTHSALLTDLYQLTMAAAYVQTGVAERATFELFVRALPPNRSYLLAAGLETALDFLESLRFAAEEVTYLRCHPAFRHVGSAFFEYLEKFRFTGEVWAVPEGTVIWAEEPIVRVTAPIAEAQIVETYLLAAINFQTLIATKAARVVQAARGRGIIEFGTRRAHGPESGVLAARAAYIGGCMGTSNALAGHWFGIPTYGTLAHSWIMAFEDEVESFRRFLEVFPDHAILLLDTYDPVAALKKMIAARLRPMGVRLDSGNLVEKSRLVRKRLDEAGMKDVRIFATGDLNEYLITELMAQGVPIDMFGVGTELATSKDAPTLGAIYKLVEVERDGRAFPCAKFSEEKVTYPGKKQIFRFSSPDGLYHRDVVGCAEESFPDALRLLEPVMRDGRRVRPSPPLAEARAFAAANLGHLHERYRQIAAVEHYPVEYSASLHQLLEVVRQQHSPAPLPHVAGPAGNSPRRAEHER